MFDLNDLVIHDEFRFVILECGNECFKVWAGTGKVEGWDEDLHGGFGDYNQGYMNKFTEEEISYIRDFGLNSMKENNGN